MGKLWAVMLVAGLAFGAGSAGAEAAKAPGAKAAGNKTAAEATKHVAVVHAGLESAEANADMLAAITANPADYDRAHGQVFVTNINEALTQVKGHLEHLQPLAVTEAQKKELRDLTERANRAANRASGMTANLDKPAELHTMAREIDRTLIDSDDNLKKVAKGINVTIDEG